MQTLRNIWKQERSRVLSGKRAFVVLAQEEWSGLVGDFAAICLPTNLRKTTLSLLIPSKRDLRSVEQFLPKLKNILDKRYPKILVTDFQVRVHGSGFAELQAEIEGRLQRIVTEERRRLAGPVRVPVPEPVLAEIDATLADNPGPVTPLLRKLMIRQWRWEQDHPDRATLLCGKPPTPGEGS